jgi:hypothetical protein
MLRKKKTGRRKLSRVNARNFTKQGMRVSSFKELSECPQNK